MKPTKTEIAQRARLINEFARQLDALLELNMSLSDAGYPITDQVNHLAGKLNDMRVQWSKDLYEVLSPEGKALTNYLNGAI